MKEVEGEGYIWEKEKEIEKRERERESGPFNISLLFFLMFLSK